MITAALTDAEFAAMYIQLGASRLARQLGIHLNTCRNRACRLGVRSTVRRGRPSTKLRAEDVAAIKERCAAGEIRRHVAEDFAIHSSHVTKILKGERWRNTRWPEPVTLQ